MSALVGLIAAAWIAGGVACAWAAWDLRRAGSEAGGGSLWMVAVAAILWPLLIVTPKAWLDRAATRKPGARVVRHTHEPDWLAGGGALTARPRRRRGLCRRLRDRLP